jgi:hypothetical protein
MVPTSKKHLLSVVAVAAAVVAGSFAMPDTAHAFFNYTPRGAPEVDASTIGSVIALAMGGVAVLGDKLRRR